MQAELDELDPLEVLKTDLSNSDVGVQLEAIRNVPAIALAIGPEKAREHVVNLLDSACFPEDYEGYTIPINNGKLGLMEEVLREVAIVLDSSMIPLLGGKDSVLPMLLLHKKLAMSDETLIREASVTSIISIAKEMDVAHVEQQVLSLVSDLSETSRWPARASAANAASRLYQYLRGDKSMEVCKNVVYMLSKDGNPMVRYEAHRMVHQMLKPMIHQNGIDLLEFIVPILRNFMCELQEDFRFHVIGIIKTLLEVDTEELLDICHEYLGYMMTDIDWRIRKKLLAELMEIVDKAPEYFINVKLLSHFVDCFFDVEPLVRLAAIKIAPELFSHRKLNPNDIKEVVTPLSIKKIMEDEFSEVREVTAGAVMDIIAITFSKNTTDEEKDLAAQIMDKFVFDDSDVVRSNFGKGLKKALSFCGESRFIDRVFPLVFKMLEDQKWRVRGTIFQHITLFAEMYKANQIKEEELCKILDTALKDPVAEARKLCIDRIAELVSILGPEWVLTKVLHVVNRQLINHKTKYHLRVSPVRVAETLATAFASDKRPAVKEIVNTALGMVIKGTQDSISNVRLASADALVRFIKSDDSCSFNSDILPALETLNKDEDKDIRLIAVEGLALL